jgi:hypothetical protein
MGYCSLFLHPSEALQILKKHDVRNTLRRLWLSERMILAQLAHRESVCYAIDDDETEIIARCIAAPIFNGWPAGGGNQYHWAGKLHAGQHVFENGEVAEGS